MKQGKMRLHIVCCLCAWTMVVCAQSPYIYKVWEFMPAPGQFVNELPEYKEGDDSNMLRLKAEEYIADDARGMISLGSFGGYVVFSFDHPIQNVEGQYDLKILGNAFVANQESGYASSNAGSSEPGIVMVSYDANGNGLPDDEWYELAGSEYNKPETRHNVNITYYKPDSKYQPVADPNNKYITDTAYIYYQTSDGEKGYIKRNSFHYQSYYPLWIDADSITFTGTLLGNNAIDVKGDGSYYLLQQFDWGYVDNKPNSCDNNEHCSEFMIDWAVDKNGNKVNLEQIHFVKVYCAMLQQCGWLGETSTEIMGAEDLHVTTAVEENSAAAKTQLLNNIITDYITITSSVSEHVQVLDLEGQQLFSANITPGTTVLPCQCLPKGLYIVRSESQSWKIIKQ